MSLSLAESKRNVENALAAAGYNYKFATEEDAAKAVLALEKAMKGKVDIGSFLSVEKPRRFDGLDAKFGDVMKKAFAKFAASQTEAGRFIDEAVARFAIKATIEKPVLPQKPTQGLPYLFARNFAYSDGVQLTKKSKSDPHEVEIDIDVRPALEGKAQHLQGLYHDIREDLLRRMQGLFERMKKDEAAVKTANDAADKAAKDAGKSPPTHAQPAPPPAALVMLSNRLHRLDLAAEAAKAGRSESTDGQDIDLQNFATALIFTGAFSGMKPDPVAAKIAGRMATLPPYQPYSDASKPAAAVKFNATCEQPLTATSEFKDGDMVITPNPQYFSGSGNAYGFYKAITTIFQRSSEGAGIPPLTIDQFLDAVSTNNDLKAAFAAWCKCEQFKVPRHLILVASWQTKAPGAKPGAA